ncbi:MOP flippase family protein [Geotalea uraniireducens]|uniref:Polysaccharide biosynthesis protein n=1 Tax=Geotalea uraniireducens (strain Rf4) TaxID=351605 RepID=A5GFE8_GEOUR|nr:MOP flippase family protein [Geotalea uraniireducens]ABQ26153.1 polysaccharide biosynthesis protein [Geotalea uraniireducens Rf4]
MLSVKEFAVSGVKWTTMSTVLMSAMEFITLTILARLLTPVDFGLMAMTMVVLGFAAGYADMGLSAVIVQRQDVSRSQLSSLYWLNLIVGTVIFVLIWAVSPLAVAFFHEPLLYWLMPVSALSFVIMSIGQQFSYLLEKDLRFDLLAKQEICACFSGNIVAIVCAFCGHGVWSLVWGHLAKAGMITVLLVWSGWSQWAPMFHFKWRDLSGYLSFGLYQMGERSIFNFNSRIDQILIGKLLGAQELGYYNFAVNQILLPLYRINPLLSRIIFPVFARLQHDIPDLRQSYLKLMKLLSALNAPLLFGLGAMAPLLIPLTFGVQWTPAVLLVQILVFSSFIRSTVEPIGSILLAKGRADISFRWNLAQAFITTPLIFIGAKLYGTLGVAVALVLLTISYAMANYIFLVRPFIGPCGKPYAFSILKVTALAVIMASIVLLMSLAGGHSVIWLIGEACVGMLIYLLLLRTVDQAFFFEVKEMLIGGGGIRQEYGVDSAQ